MAKKKTKEDDSIAHFFGGTDDVGEELLDGPVTEPADETDDLATNLEGEIAVDVYQTPTHVVIVSPIAGVDPDNIEITSLDDSITITGERTGEHTSDEKNVFTQEIYWGAFSRTVVLPVPCLVDKASASFKHGVLTVKIPKTSKAKKKTIKVKAE